MDSTVTALPPATPVSIQDVARKVAGLFHPAVVVEVASNELRLDELYPDERTHIAGSVPKRQAEFATARMCIRRALARLRRSPCSLVPYDDRSPRWPSGVIGTITHSGSVCAIAIAEASAVTSIGLDIEGASPLKADLEEAVCTPNERRWITDNHPGARGQWAKLIFSAKEAFYKCHYPVRKVFLDFQDVELAVEPESETFVATILGRSDWAEVPRVRGRWSYGGGFVITACTL